MADAGRLSEKHALTSGAGGGIELAVAVASIAESAKGTIVELGTITLDSGVTLA